MNRQSILVFVILVLLGSGGFLILKAQRPAPPPVVAPTITPNLVTINRPTPVVATISIPDPTLNPSQVDLVRVNTNGSTVVVAPMVDNGQNGDQKPGDKIFTASITLSEATPSAFGFQVATVFRGQNQVFSPIQQVAALAPTTVPVVLPPDPGEAGKATLAGIDSDNDGVRDDVQRYIVFTYPGSEKTRVALFQSARAWQTLLLNGVRTNADELIQSDICLESVLGGVVPAAPVSRTLQAEFLNTKARTKTFISIDRNMSGSFSFGSLDSRPTFCQFDPSSMRN